MDDWHWRRDEAGRALTLETARPPRRPPLRVEAASPFLLRWVAGERPFLWAAVEDGQTGWWWTGADFLRADGPRDVLPPWPAGELRAVEAAPRSDAWWAHWLRRTAQELLASPLTPLHGPRWRLAAVEPDAKPQPYPAIPGSWAEQRPSPPTALAAHRSLASAWSEDWGDLEAGGVLPLRALAAEDTGRLKAWRKRLRDGDCPPLLLLYSGLLRKHLLLDGHVRLAAALEEGTAPPLLALWQEWIAPPDPERWTPLLERADQLVRMWRGPPEEAGPAANRYLLSAGASPPLVRSLAWHLRGGRTRWEEEVRARLASAPAEPDVAAALLRPRR